MLLQSYDSAAAQYTSNSDYHTLPHSAYKTRSTEVRFPPLSFGLWACSGDGVSPWVLGSFGLRDLHDRIKKKKLCMYFEIMMPLI